MIGITRSPSTALPWRVRTGALLAAAVLSFAAAAPASAQCVGDCNDSGQVSTDELIIGIDIGLGIMDVSACRRFDANHDDTVVIDELVLGIDNAINGCEGSTRPTATATPLGPTPTPTVMPVCGNRHIEAGESCDDGNTVDGDDCPATCVIHDCLSTPTTFDTDVLIQPPGDAVFGALQVFVRYPDGVVTQPTVTFPDDAFTMSVNDLLYGMKVLALGPGGLTLAEDPPNRFVAAEFRRCQGAAAPAASDFTCKMLNATTVDGMDLTAQTTCSVSLP